MFVRAISVEPPEYEIGLASKTDEKKQRKMITAKIPIGGMVLVHWALSIICLG